MQTQKLACIHLSYEVSIKVIRNREGNNIFFSAHMLLKKTLDHEKHKQKSC